MATAQKAIIDSGTPLLPGPTSAVDSCSAVLLRYEWAKPMRRTDLETQLATRSSMLETVVLKSCVLDGKFAELQADPGPCQDSD